MAFHTIILLGTLTGILLAVGWFFAGPLGMTVALAFSVLLNLVAYYYSDKIALKMYKAKPSEDAELNGIVERVARQAKVPKPRVYSVPTRVPNAFATGRSPKNAAIAITDGLKMLNPEEMEAVISHEMGHIKNHDILVSSLAATIAGAIAYVAQMSYWSLFMQQERQGEGNMLGLIFMVVFAPLAAMLVRLAISRSREYKADITGAMLTHKPHALASALRKIESVAREHPLRGGSAATAHMWIVNPFSQDWFTGLFMTHPPIEKRVERLERLAAL
ncbi:MAG: zinc metalloprotease HtpX [Candidatus Aenigmarchaeota archaeon]|nr:zinc metalloprotease HtpX [Candidatus Aenigmarchaeota archaeon]